MAPKKTSAGRSSGSSKASKKTSAKKTSQSSKTSKKSSATSKRSTAKKPTVKKTAAKSTSKKSTAKKPAAKKTAAKAAPKKTAAKKPTVKKTPAKASRTSSRTGATRPSNATVRSPQQRGPKPRPVRPAKFDAAQLKAIRAGLEEKRAELQTRQEELEEDSFDSTQSEITGEVGLDEDFADAGTATFERERDLSIRNNIYDLIDQMTRAIGRIDEGTYGTCERCGRPIDAARLKELPYALLCLDCKRREERAR
ncbi:MAG: TraR/DksA family transcriptional regulator [Actinomycetota bacterium]